MWDVAASAEVVGSQHHRTATLEPAVDAVGAEVTCLQTLEAAGLIASVSAATAATVHIWDPRGPQQLARTSAAAARLRLRGAGWQRRHLPRRHADSLVGGADGGVRRRGHPGGRRSRPSRRRQRRRRRRAPLACASPAEPPPPPPTTARFQALREGTTSARECIARLSAGGGAGCLAVAAPPARCCLAAAPTARWRRGASACCAMRRRPGDADEWAWDLDVSCIGRKQQGEPRKAKFIEP